MSYHDIHQSGFHGVGPDRRKAMNHDVAAQCSVAALTEQQGFDFLVKGWGQHGTESKIVWDAERWSLVRGGSVVVPTSHWVRGTSRRDSVVWTWALLSRVRDPHYLMQRVVVHLPAHLFDRDQMLANEQAVEGAVDPLLELQKGYEPTETTISLDGNREVRLPKNQRFFNQLAQPLGLTLLIPPGATLRGALHRRIDPFMTDAHSRLSMIDWLPGYDHRGVRRMVLTK